MCKSLYFADPIEFKMRLSIIIPYYNAEQWIERCLDSLIHQDIPHNEYEIIVVDDGSTHDISILKSYVEKYDFIKYVWQQNAMQGAARNKGLEMARGEYVFFCDSDDFIVENRLGCICQMAETNKLDMLMYEILHVKNGIIPNRDIFDLNSLRTWESGKAFMSTPRHKINYYPWKYITRREFLMQHHLRFPTDKILFEDGVFFLNMIQVAGRVGEVKVLLYYYVTNPESIIHSLGKKKKHKLYIENILEYTALIKKNYEALQNDPEINDWAKTYMVNLMGDNAFFAMHNTARYGTLASNRDLIKRLRSLGAYPIRHTNTDKYIKLVKLMNIYPIWIIICAMICILPKSIRYKF